MSADLNELRHQMDLFQRSQISWGEMRVRIEAFAAALSARPKEAAPSEELAQALREAENIIAALLRDTEDYGRPALVAKHWAQEFMRRAALAATQAPQEAKP